MWPVNITEWFIDEIIMWLWGMSACLVSIFHDLHRVFSTNRKPYGEQMKNEGHCRVSLPLLTC